MLWAAGTLLAMLRYHLAPRLRTWAEGPRTCDFSRPLSLCAALLLALDAARLPLDLFGHGIDLHYDQSVQGWASWGFDWAKGELIEFVVAIVLGWMLYSLIRRSPRRWWFDFWLASLPILVFLLFIEPWAEIELAILPVRASSSLTSGKPG